MKVFCFFFTKKMGFVLVKEKQAVLF